MDRPGSEDVEVEVEAEADEACRPLEVDGRQAELRRQAELQRATEAA
jgi:hypothetical protein